MKLAVSTHLNDCRKIPQHWTVDFLNACEQSSIIGPEYGWLPLYFSADLGNFSYGFIKSHSYGEYIFDWAWADLYQRYGIEYYPKLIHALPFTPVNAKKVFGADQSDFLTLIYHYYQSNHELNSDHWYFVDQDIVNILTGLGYFHQKTIQYHFNNTYSSFDEFLDSLKMRKRKQIKKERMKVNDYPLTIAFKRGNQLENEEIQRIFDLYQLTINKKQAYAYLNLPFFIKLIKEMGARVSFQLAFKENEIIAMSMFLENEKTLYGRYWGILPEYEEAYSFLHFELCYYRAIEYCINQKLTLFEAGAQGEQKLLRGFEPVVIHSAHHLKNRELATAIGEHIQLTNVKVEEEIIRLKNFLPYKSQ